LSSSANDDISTTRHGHGVFGVFGSSFSTEQVIICTPSANGVSSLVQHYIHDLALQMDAPFPSRLAWQGKAR
jgi:hypothetical protein